VRVKARQAGNNIVAAGSTVGLLCGIMAWLLHINVMHGRGEGKLKTARRLRPVSSSPWAVLQAPHLG